VATRSRKSGFLDSFADVHSPDAVRREFIEAPMDAARVAALGSLMEVGGLMTALPQAFVGSQRRELERLRAKRGADDSRVEALQASIDRAGAFRAMAERGEAATPAGTRRAWRSGACLPRLCLRLGLRAAGGCDRAAGPQGHQRDDVVRHDGCRRLFPHSPRNESRCAGERRRREVRGQHGRSNRRDARADGRADRTAPAATEKDKGPTEQASVEIVSKGKLLYRDPAPIPWVAAASIANT